MTTLTNGDGTVSIHASAREATGFRVNLDAQEVVSIHASAREATIHAHAIAPRGRRRRLSARRWRRHCFNPRLREGGDMLDRYKRRVGLCFNPRLREGGDFGCENL